MRCGGLLMFLALGACRPAGQEDWWTVSTGYTGPETLPPADTANLDTGEGGDADARELQGSLRQANMTAEVELRYYFAVGGEVRCDVRYDSVAFAQNSTCKPCLQAFTITYGAPSIVAEQDGTCTQEGWDSLEGSDLHIGLDAAATLWQDAGSGWVEAGTASPSSSGFTFVIPL